MSTETNYMYSQLQLVLIYISPSSVISCTWLNLSECKENLTFVIRNIMRAEAKFNQFVR